MDPTTTTVNSANTTDGTTPLEEGVYAVTLPTGDGYTVTGDAQTTKDTAYTFTVTPAEGYKITEVKYAVAGGDSAVLTAKDGTTDTYEIAAEKLTGAVTITVTAKQYYTMTATVTEADTATLTYSVKNGAADQALTVGTPVELLKGDVVTLKVTPAADYAVTGVKNGDKALTAKNGGYEITVNANVQIAVTTEKNKFAVTEEITKDSEGESKALAAIAYTNNCVAEGKINKGKALTFKVNPPEGGTFDGKKVIVSYKVGATGEETVLTPNAQKVYTVPAAKITDDVTLKVEVREYQKYSVSWATGVADVEKVEYKVGSAAEWTILNAENGWSAQIAEDSKLTFKVTPAKYHKISSVYVGDSKLNPNTSGVYTYTVTKAAQIEIGTAPNAAQYNKFTLNVTGDAGSVTASASVSENTAAKYAINPLNPGKAVSISGNTIEVSVTPKAGYKITKIDGQNVADDKATEAQSRFYTYSGKQNAKTMTVVTAPIASANAKVVTFKNQAGHMSYKVTNGNGVSVSANDIFAIAETAERLKFSVTAESGYGPTVKRNDAGNSEVEVDYTKKTPNAKTGATVYEYTIPAGLLADESTITITETEIKHTVTVNGLTDGSTDAATVSASIDGRKFAAEADGTYSVTENKTIALQIKPATGYKLVSVASQIGNPQTNVRITNGVANFEVKVTADATVTVETEAIYSFSQLKDNDAEMTPADAKKNAYKVKYDGTYTVDVTKGADVPVTDDDGLTVKVMDGKKAAQLATAGVDCAGIANGTVTIELAKVNNAAGKNLTLQICKDNKVIPGGAFVLNVTAPVKDIKIGGKAAFAANQAVDTIQTYKVTAAKAVDLESLEATVDDAGKALIVHDEGKVTYENGVLTVQTTAAAPAADAKAVITIKEKGAAADAQAAMLTITPKISLVTNNTAAPGVKLAAATDTSLKLTLTSGNIKAASGNLYYKVKAVAGDKTKIEYVKKNGVKQENWISVSGNNVTAGNGGKTEYQVSASLVHTKEDVSSATADTTGDGSIAEKVLAESKTSKAAKMSTQTPAYDAKLGLTKGRTSLATGEQDVVIATVKFSNYTTWLELADGSEVTDLSYSDDKALTFKLDKNDPSAIKVMASADWAKTALGKHKIQVTAKAETGARPSVATIDVTVVQGIHDLEVVVPSTNLYKVNKKAATLKAKVNYNYDMPQPKNKSVKWELVAVGDSGFATEIPYTGAKINAKTGVVTVDKNYIVQGDKNDQFVIRVTAENTDKKYAGIDADGDAVTEDSDVITITNEAEPVKALAIVDSDMKMVAMGGTKKAPVSVEASELTGGVGVVVLNDTTGITKGQGINMDKILNYDNANFTFNSSAKGFVMADGEINEPVKLGKTSITATANDGSKKKAEMWLNVINDATAGKKLSLKVMKASYAADGSMAADSGSDAVLYDPATGAQPAADGKVVFGPIDASTTPLIAVTLMVGTTADNGTTWENALPYVNYKLATDNGGVMLQKGVTSFISIKPGKNLKITLTDPVNKTGTGKKATNTVTIFELTNNGKAVAPKFTPGKLKKQGRASEQKADIKVEKLGDLTATADLKAKIEVDWTAKNAKNEMDLAVFQAHLEESYAVTDVDAAKKTGKIAFALKEMNGVSNEVIKLPQNQYKLKVTLGTVTDDVFTAVSAPVAMTVKVDGAKAFTFTPAANYTLYTKDQAAEADLTGKANLKANEFAVDYSSTGLGLENWNNKGKTNDFTSYFEIENNKLKLKSNVTTLPTGDDLKGWLTYNAKPTVGTHTLGKGAGVNTILITVKLDQAKMTYSWDKKDKEIGNTKDETLAINIQVKEGNHTPSTADLAYVAVGTDKNSKDFKAEPIVVGNGLRNVTLTYTGETPLSTGNKKITLYVVPARSWNATVITAMDEGARADAVRAMGVKVDVTLKVIKTKTPVEKAQAAVTTWLNDVKNAQTKPLWLKNSLTAVDLITRIMDETDGVELAEGITVECAKKGNTTDEDYTVTAATLTKAGKIKGTLAVKSSDETKTVSFELPIPAKAISKTEAAKSISENSTVKGIKVANDDNAGDAKTAKEKEILDAAQAALGETYYTVAVKNGGLSITQAATTEAAGSATITLEVTENGITGDTPAETELTYTIEKLPAATP